MSVVLPRVSEEEFLSLPESMERIELVDGEVVVSPSPTIWHQELVVRIAHALKGWAESRHDPTFVGVAPLDVRFGPGRILQPDVFVVLGRVPLDASGPVTRVPEVCVEVVSDNRAYDRVTKRLLYAAAGVRELWIVEPAGALERWHGEGLLAREEIPALGSPLLPGFALEADALFRQA